ncbi:hypothetical protein NUSPORA_00799 [Nucleospora cyclopteri]
MNPKDIEIAKAFKIFANEEQMVLQKDIPTVVRCLGFVINDQMAFPDKNVTLQEFHEIILNLSDESSIFTKENIDDAFKMLDPENTGYVKAQDLRTVLHEDVDGLSEEEVNNFFTNYSPNAEGKVSYKVLLEKLFKTN